MPRSRIVSAAALAALLLVAGPARAHDHGGHAAPAATASAEAFGEVRIPTSCTPEAERLLQGAIARLHSFEPAVEAFEAAGAADPTCALAWWGAAMSARGNPLTGAVAADAFAEGREHLARARAIGGRTPLERGLIEALGVYYADHASHAERTAAYEAAMARLAGAFPDEPEVQAFYGLALLEAVDLTDKSYRRQLAAAAVLEKLWAAHPEHPGAPHYLIHAYDYAPLAERGLAAARRYSAIAPASVHARHMASHIFTMRGDWKESIAANQAAGAAFDPSAAPGVEQDTAFLHGWDFIAYARLQLAQDRQVEAGLERLRATTGAPVLFEARYALERGDWKAAAKAPTDPGSPLDDAFARFARALGAARSGDLAAARREARALKALRGPVLRTETPYWAGLVDVYAAAAQAWIAKGEGRPRAARAAMARAADLDDRREKHISLENRLLPMRELYGELLLETGRPLEAGAAFRQALSASPNRYRSYAGAAAAAAAAGRPAEARRWSAALLELTRDADTDRPEMRAARRRLATAGGAGASSGVR